jgi:hypothetical protein
MESNKISTENTNYQIINDLVTFFSLIDTYLSKSFVDINEFTDYYAMSFSKSFNAYDTQIEKTMNPNIFIYLLRLIKELELYTTDQLINQILDKHFKHGGLTDKIYQDYINHVRNTKAKSCLENIFNNTTINLLKEIRPNDLFKSLHENYYSPDLMPLILTRLILLIKNPEDPVFELLVIRGFSLDRPGNDITITDTYIQGIKNLLDVLFAEEDFILAFNNLNNSFGIDHTLSDTKKELLLINDNLKDRIFFLYVYSL